MARVEMDFAFFFLENGCVLTAVVNVFRMGMVFACC